MKIKIISWIKQKVNDSGAKGIVLGLSGGIDSAVVAALAKAAVGKNNLLVLFMPCNSNPQDLKDAKLVAHKLRLKSKLVDLSAVYNNFLKVLPGAISLARGNLKPRLRMSTLYYFANKLNYLVCGTGNKSELLVGYFTKYGDGGVDILPIADLFKRQVRQLAKELKIPQDIITKAPTAGLWHGQTDEGEMGITYNELDDILDRFCNHKKQVAGSKKVDKVIRMYKNSEHKRKGADICHI
ncbi:MAG: NAD+ synthase [Candidatus Omnitrophica bacterium]|nr:NAD+ synthase [Candidatus Omnitrophota bacterium]MBU4303977.1 NAD+ synthase [Candidatus Omnitrophota bacterium]MBU4419354.1 NAD+ synthase [Candidatus Omnitrophota bacterium]MBU4467862.1 NAD+ synthase [Candidatus Omnitrophota bacterium]MCG2707081.1 NAD+ synthase [Candidatus Omnitrophota bacterium]